MLLKDINAGGANLGSTPRELARLGPFALFSAHTASTGTELYRTTAKPGSATLVADLAPGPASSSPHPLGVVNGQLLFLANSDQILLTDGSAAGTTLLFTVSGPRGPGSGSAQLGSDFLFVLDNGPFGAELWKTNGTAVGTTLVKSFSGVGSIREMEAIGGAVYFNADDGGGAGVELWRSDGTPAGTSLVADIRPGRGSSVVQQLTNLNGVLYFLADSSGSATTLWRSDGTAVGTTQLSSAPASAIGVEALIAFQGALYFAAADPMGGVGLWRSDGTAAGTQLVVNPSPGNALPVGAFAPVGGALVFTVFGQGLFRTDGTAAGTVLVHPVLPLGMQQAQGYALAGNSVYFAGVDTTTGDIELWCTDSTAAGTRMVADLRLGLPSLLTPFAVIANPFGAGVIFAADDGLTGLEPWASDGTAPGTRQIADLEQAPAGNPDSVPQSGVDVYGITYFVADDGIHGNELWKTDGTPNGTVLVKDIAVGSPSAFLSSGQKFGVLGREVFFTATDGSTGLELWKSDGTDAGTVLVRDIAPGGMGSGPLQFALAGGQLFFSAADANGTELWKTDGTTAGTVLVADIEPGSGSSYPMFFQPFQGLLLFWAGTIANGRELWKSDGTAAGTQLLLDIAPGTPSSSPRPVAVLDDMYLFSASSDSISIKLWRTDGTAAGTTIVSTVAPVGSGAAFAGKAYFAAFDAATGIELWTSDGTAAGTVLVKDLMAGPASSVPRSFAIATGGLLFVGNDTGVELWRTDGTAAGTINLDLWPGIQGSNPLAITAVGSRQALLFARDAVAGVEPWITDGTPAGSRRLADLRPGLLGSQPRAPFIVLSGGKALFNANDGVLGDEVYVYDPGATAQPVGAGCGVKGLAAQLQADDPVLGTTMTLRASGLTGALGLAMIGGPRAPLALPGTPCALYLDPNSLAVLAAVPTVNGAFQTSVQVPNAPVLSGLQVGVQAAAAFIAAPPGFELTHGVILTLGN